MTTIDGEKNSVFLGASTKCIIKLHKTIKKRDIKNETLLNPFLLEVANLLISCMRRYIFELDNRKVAIAEPIICNTITKTKYGISRYFLIDNELMLGMY